MNQSRSEAVAQSYSIKKVFSQISQNSQENTCARVCFLVNFVKFARTLFFIEHLPWLPTSTRSNKYIPTFPRSTRFWAASFWAFFVKISMFLSELKPFQPDKCVFKVTNIGFKPLIRLDNAQVSIKDFFS